MISKIGLAAILIAVISPVLAFAAPGSVSIDIGGTSYDVSYDTEGVEILDVEPDLDEIELIIFVDVSASPGILEITFDRTFFDSLFEDLDDEFFVIADGDFVDFGETETTFQSRTLRIELPAGTEEVEIFGTVLAGVTYGAETIPQPPPETPTEPPPVEEPEEEIIMRPTEETPEPEEEEVPELPETETMPKVECGPGTVLKDGECVLDERCGPGTHLEDDTCVPDAVSSPIEKSQMNQLIIGAGIAFGIAFVVIIFLWIIARGSSQKRPASVQ